MTKIIGSPIVNFEERTALDIAKELYEEQQRIEELQKAVRIKASFFAEKAKAGFIANGWEPPKKSNYIISPWDKLSRAPSLEDFSKTVYMLSSSPSDDWLKILNLKFPIVETRIFLDEFFIKKVKIEYDDGEIDYEDANGSFPTLGGYSTKGFSAWSTFGASYSEITRNAQFLKKAGKNRRIYMLLGSPFILRGDKNFDKITPGDSNYIHLTSDVKMYGILISVNTKTKTFTFYNGHESWQKKYPNKEDSLISFLDSSLDVFHKKIREQAAEDLTSADEYTRKYAEFACSSLLFKENK